MSEAVAALEGQFRDLEQQREAASLGMWIFLMTELLLFGALFTAYAVYRLSYPAAFAAASRLSVPSVRSRFVKANCSPILRISSLGGIAVS